MFAIDEYGCARLVDENVDESIVVYLESEIGNSYQSANCEIREIEGVIAERRTYRRVGNALSINFGCDVTILRWMVGKLRDTELKVDTYKLLNYVVSWRDFLLAHGKE